MMRGVGTMVMVKRKRYRDIDVIQLESPSRAKPWAGGGSALVAAVGDFDLARMGRARAVQQAVD